MSGTRAQNNLRSLAVILVIGGIGVAAAAYVLLHERLPNPFQSTYSLNVALPAANGVVPGLGQPVNVAGVQAGSITGARLADGVAVVTLTMQRNDVSHVYANAVATLDPITPLGDVQINLDPGHPPARALHQGATLGSLGQSPVPLSTLLSSLDSDTRDFLTSLITSMGQGTAGRGRDLRQLFVALGPTVGQVHAITAALAQRRQALARLVRNLSIVTQAASQDNQLAAVVKAGDQTLHAVATQDTALSQAIVQLPATLRGTDDTLARAAAFADKLGPASTALLPGIRGLPHALELARPFAQTATAVLRDAVMPLVARAQPLAHNLGPTITGLSSLAPSMTSAFQTLDYALNELAYNPGGTDPGFLFWLSWMAQNWNSMSSFGDAHGAFVRAGLFVNCSQILNLGGALGPIFKVLLGSASACPPG
jgi:phospholipid/cholesterol/gamma-HCH transport system substrate-binding protein